MSLDSVSLPSDYPRRPPRGVGWRHHLAKHVLRLFGWSPVGDPPDLKKYVIVAAPHTALSDGFWMNAFAWYWGVEIFWLVKQSAAAGPLWSAFMRWAGAIPIDRSSPQGLSAELAQQFRDSDTLVVSISPEGTRARRDYWKSGFYQIALAADVPVCLSHLDFGNKRGGFGPCFKLTGNRAADMDRVRAFYKDVRGKHPELFTEPRLKEETETETASTSAPPPASQP